MNSNFSNLQYGVFIMQIDLSKADRDMTKLCPWFASKVEEAIKIVNEAGYPIKITEGYRSPARQDWLFEQGRSRPGKRVTDARGWGSFHQYSLAVDIAFWDGKKFYWPDKTDTLWDRVDALMEDQGFESLGFERPHHQIARALSPLEAYKIARQQGLMAVWDVVFRRL